METDLLKTDNNPSVKKRIRQADRVVNLALLFNALLAAVKVSAGLLGHSRALLADGINSVSDVVYLLFVKSLVRMSGKPSDEQHPYGHHQFESIAAVVVGAFIITTGIAIFWDSASAALRILGGEATKGNIQFYTLIVAIATVIIKIFLMLNAFSVSRKTGNIAVTALARDHLNDILASLGVSTGIVLGLMGYIWVDPAAGALVAVIIIKTGIEVLRESTSELMDTVPGRALDAMIRSNIVGFDRVRSVESVHTHRFGPYYVANITVILDRDLKVSESDKIADRLENHLCNNIELLRRVYIHYHAPV